jgi:predicted site-specific integrase-resolvase
MSGNNKRSGARHGAEQLPKAWPVKMKVSQAAKFLGISSSTMSNMIGSGKIKYEPDPLDNRVKLVRRVDLEDLLRKRTQ